MLQPPQKRRRPSYSNSGDHYPGTEPDDVGQEIPRSIWQLNEIGDLVDDLRIIWSESFAETVKIMHNWEQNCYRHHNVKHADAQKQCRINLQTRLYQEATYMSLLFRRIAIEFPKLTRLALFIPVALYPLQDPIFIDKVLPGTRWRVKHYGSGGGDPENRGGDYEEEAYRELSSELCPFIHRVFARSYPTEDPACRIVHDEEGHATKRPPVDLGGDEHYSMDENLTVPLREAWAEEFWG